MECEPDTIVDYVASSLPASPDEPVLVAGDPACMTSAMVSPGAIEIDTESSTGRSSSCTSVHRETALANAAAICLPPSRDRAVT